MIPFDYSETEAQLNPLSLWRRLRDTLQSLVRAVTNDKLIGVTFSVAATDTPVRHALGAPVTTWEVVNIDGDANVWQSATANPNARQVLILQASAPVRALIRVT